ncbi:methionyl-tRNA formyltransferase [Kordiimonas sp.]|uniref:methionyl-tRNA formyltransferase n=1 Tax=Kordiimonas sp. TaxID=1970157 RepID=UPI003A8F32F7
MSQPAIPAFFIGCVRSSDVALATLLDDPAIDVRGVLTLKASKFNADFVDISARATAAHVPVHYAEDADQDALAALLRSAGVQLLFVVGWSRLLGTDILSIPKIGTVGYHPAALPANRGRHPLIWALALGLEETASTFFLMDEGADSGPVLDQEPLAIAPDDDAATLYDKALAVIPDQLRAITKGLAEGTLKPGPQDHSKATYWRKRGAADGLIDWRMPATGIHNLVRALTKPYIGADFRVGDDLVKLWRCAIVDHAVPVNAEPGKVLATGSEGLIIKAGVGAVRLIETGTMPTLKEGDYL